MDYKFWSTLAVNICGLGFTYWQVRLMKNQISLPPATKAKQLKVAQQITRKMYRPVFIMAALVLVSWLPYVLRSRGSDALPSILAAWGGTDKGCNALLNTSPIASAKNKYHL